MPRISKPCSWTFEKSSLAIKMFTASSKGKPILVVDGHEFFKKRERKSTTTWNCSQYQKLKCRATATSNWPISIIFFKEVKIVLIDNVIGHCLRLAVVFFFCERWFCYRVLLVLSDTHFFNYDLNKRKNRKLFIVDDWCLLIVVKSVINLRRIWLWSEMNLGWNECGVKWMWGEMNVG